METPLFPPTSGPSPVVSVTAQGAELSRRDILKEKVAALIKEKFRDHPVTPEIETELTKITEVILSIQENLNKTGDNQAKLVSLMDWNLALIDQVKKAERLLVREGINKDLSKVKEQFKDIEVELGNLIRELPGLKGERATRKIQEIQAKFARIEEINLFLKEKMKIAKANNLKIDWSEIISAQARLEGVRAVLGASVKIGPR